MKMYDISNPKLVKSVVCFADILGFSAMIRQPGNANDLLHRLHQALKVGIRELRPVQELPWVLKAFTDNIILGKPISDDGEMEMGFTLLEVAAYQMSLILHGFFVRGGISVGNYYADADFAFGKALLEAHELEHNHAHYPRVILSDDAVALIQKHMDYYPIDTENPYLDELLTDDVDGKWFVNYLFVTHEKGPTHAYTLLLNHKNTVESNLQQFLGNWKVYEKYVWVARYHNYFCGQLDFTAQKKRELKIAISYPDKGFSVPTR